MSWKTETSINSVDVAARAALNNLFLVISQSQHLDGGDELTGRMKAFGYPYLGKLGRLAVGREALIITGFHLIGSNDRGFNDSELVGGIASQVIKIASHAWSHSQVIGLSQRWTASGFCLSAHEVSSQQKLTKLRQAFTGNQIRLEASQVDNFYLQKSFSSVFSIVY
jgi:hypothetical protein